MNIVLPMAGRGSRFSNQGYTTPKPLIEVLGKPMFAHALDTIKHLKYENLVIVTLEEHKTQYKVDELINQYCPDAKTIYLPNVTDGQLCTVLAAKQHIDNERDLLIISSDTIVVSDLHLQLQNHNHSGLISVANMPGDRWSFAATDENENVTMVAEKHRISNHASTGIYYFNNSRQFLNIAEEMVFKNEKTKGEYYVIPVYQKLINSGFSVGISKASEMYDLGTPESLSEYIEYRLNS